MFHILTFITFEMSQLSILAGEEVQFYGPANFLVLSHYDYYPFFLPLLGDLTDFVHVVVLANEVQFLLSRPQILPGNLFGFDFDR